MGIETTGQSVCWSIICCDFANCTDPVDGIHFGWQWCNSTDLVGCVMSLDTVVDRCGKLMSVELLNAVGRSLREAEVGRGWEIDVPVLTVRWVNGGIDLVASPYSVSHKG